MVCFFQAIGHQPLRDVPEIQGLDELDGASWVTFTAVRNVAEISDRHRCLKNSDPARTCLRRREGPSQSGSIFAESHFKKATLIFNAITIPKSRCTNQHFIVEVLCLCGEKLTIPTPRKTSTAATPLAHVIVSMPAARLMHMATTGCT